MDNQKTIKPKSKNYLFLKNKIYLKLIIAFFLLVVSIYFVYPQNILIFFDGENENYKYLKICPEIGFPTKKIQLKTNYYGAGGNPTVSFDQTNKILYIFDNVDKTLFSVDMESLKVKNLKIKEKMIEDITFSSDGKYYSGNLNFNLLVFNSDTKSQVFNTSSYQYSLATWFNEVGKLIQLNNDGSYLEVVDLKKKTIVHRIPFSDFLTDFCYGLDISPHNDQIVCTYSQTQLLDKYKTFGIALFPINRKINQKKVIINNRIGIPSSAYWSANGENLFFSVDGKIYKYNLKKGKENFVRKGFSPKILPIKKNIFYYF